MFGPDLAPVADEEIETFLGRFGGLREELAGWADGRTGVELGVSPAGGRRPARAVLLHLLGATGGYLSAALGGAPGFSAVHGAAARPLDCHPACCYSIT